MDTFGVPHAIYAAAFLCAMTKAAPELNIVLINYFQPINEGAFTVNPFSVTQTPVGQVFQLYAEHQQGHRVQLIGSDPNLDVLATVHCSKWGGVISDTDQLIVSVVHLDAHASHDRHVVVTLKHWISGPSQPQFANVTTLRAQGFSQTSLFDSLQSTQVVSAKGELSLEIPPFSVVHVRVRLAVWCERATDHPSSSSPSSQVGFPPSFSYYC